MLFICVCAVPARGRVRGARAGAAARAGLAAAGLRPPRAHRAQAARAAREGAADPAVPYIMTHLYYTQPTTSQSPPLHTYHSRFIPEGQEVSQIFLQDTLDLPKLVSYEEHCSRDRW
jgi:hypothetical protein